MTAPRFARGTKSRIFLYIGVLAFIGIAVCIFHETQSRMDDVRKSAEKCQQQQESLAAQLQVIFEYKLRLEKSVQQEKAEHRHTREELHTQLEEERARRHKEVLEATNKLASLQQHYKLLQGQHEDLAEECNKARAISTKANEFRTRAEVQLQQLKVTKEKELEQLKSQLLQKQRENEKLVKQAKDAVDQGQQAADLASSLKIRNVGLQSEIKRANKALMSCAGYSSSPTLSSAAAVSSSSVHQAVLSNDQQSVLHQPNVALKASSASTAAPISLISSTNDKSVPRGSSQVAPVPAPGPPQMDNVGAKPALFKQNPPLVANDSWQRIPAGVVPAPHVYHDAAPNYQDMDQLEIRNKAGLEESHQLVQPLLPAHMIPPQPLFQGLQRREAVEDGVVAPEDKQQQIGVPQWKAVGGEEEEEGGRVYRQYHGGEDDRGHVENGGRQYHHGQDGQYHGQENYKEEDDDRGHQGQGQGEHAPGGGEPHEDLQLEDVEEDDDDDVDQIDYGNEVVNNPKHKQIKKIPVVGKHESVMVNPK